MNFLFNLFIGIPIRLLFYGTIALIALVVVVIGIILGIKMYNRPKRIVPVLKNILRERDRIKAKIEIAVGEPALLKCGDMIRRFQDDYYEDPDCYQFTKELWEAYNVQACVVEVKRLVKV